MEKRASQLPADSTNEHASNNSSSPSSTKQTAAADDVIVLNKDHKKFKILPFKKKYGKPAKPASVEHAVLPTVQLMDIATEVEIRIGVGRKSLASEEFLM